MPLQSDDCPQYRDKTLARRQDGGNAGGTYPVTRMATGGMVLAPPCTNDIKCEKCFWDCQDHALLG